MRILFIIGQAKLGGIETYCLRMCRELSRRGHALDVWFVRPQADRALLGEFERVATVRFLSRVAPVPLLPIAPRVAPDCDLIFTTGRLSLIFGALSMKGARPPRLVAGVFSQWEYSGAAGDYKSRISRAILAQIGWRNMVFCTEGCRTFHLEALGETVAGSLVSPLLVRLPERRPPAPRDRTPLRIVSIGNFTTFKTYHFTLPAVIAALRDAGLAIEWTIFGDGEERPEIERRIAAAGVGDVVRLAGRLDYARFGEEVGAADLYVGAGTTLIEASALGVPAMVALDDNPEPTTPGFFCDREGTFTSDHAEGDRLIPFAEVIAEFAAMSDAARAALGERSMARAKAYSIKRAEGEIAAIVERAQPVRPRIGIAMRMGYVLGVMTEIGRVMFGRGTYRVR